MRPRLSRLLAWLRSWSAMESTGRYAWGPDDPPPASPSDDEVIDRMERQFDREEGRP